MEAWGRLTLISGQPRMNTNVSSSTLYYTPFETDEYSELGLVALTNGWYDIFLSKNNNSIYAHPGPGVFIKSNGLWVNANMDMYVGSVYVVNTEMFWQPNLPAAPYGSNPMLGVFNAYNRLPVIARCVDSTSIWQYANAGLRFANNSNNNRISWVDGLGDVMCRGVYTCSVAGTSTHNAAITVGVGFNQTQYPITWRGELPQEAMNSAFIGGQIFGADVNFGQIGLNCWQAIEQSTSVPVNVFGNNFCELRCELSI